jgi:hypothetical protein
MEKEVKVITIYVICICVRIKNDELMKKALSKSFHDRGMCFGRKPVLI